MRMKVVLRDTAMEGKSHRLVLLARLCHLIRFVYARGAAAAATMRGNKDDCSIRETIVSTLRMANQSSIPLKG